MFRSMVTQEQEASCSSTLHAPPSSVSDLLTGSSSLHAPSPKSAQTCVKMVTKELPAQQEMKPPLASSTFPFPPPVSSSQAPPPQPAPPSPPPSWFPYVFPSIVIGGSILVLAAVVAPSTGILKEGLEVMKKVLDHGIAADYCILAGKAHFHFKE